MLTASCHCGAVTIEVSRRPRSLTRCTCSICHRYGALWAYCTRKTARVFAAQGSITAYLWNDKVIEFYHCNECGCLTHYESIEKSPQSRVAVNARMLLPADISGARIRTFDGAKTWKYLD
jgi:hypothetical protein